MVIFAKVNLSHSSKSSRVNHLREIPLYDRGIQLGQGVINHDDAIITWVIGIIGLKDEVNDVGSLGKRKTNVNNIIEELHEDGEGVDDMLEEFSLKIFNVYCIPWV